jgi:hypothetical protein
MNTVGMGEGNLRNSTNGGSGAEYETVSSRQSNMETARALAASSALLRSAHRDEYESSRNRSGIYTSGFGSSMGGGLGGGGGGGGSDAGGGTRGGFGGSGKYGNGGGIAGGLEDAVLLGDVGNVTVHAHHSTFGDEASTQGGNLDNFSSHSQTSDYMDLSMRNNANSTPMAHGGGVGDYHHNQSIGSHHGNNSSNHSRRRLSSGDEGHSYGVESPITSPLLQQDHGLVTVIESARASDLSVEDLNTLHSSTPSSNYQTLQEEEEGEGNDVESTTKLLKKEKGVKK